MTSSDEFTDNLSDAGKQQLARQLDFFHLFTSRAFDHAERLLALNMETARATLDQTSGAVRQLAAAREPRDLLALGTESQRQVAAVMGYSRKLFDIVGKPADTGADAGANAAADAQANPAAAAPAPEPHIVSAAPVMVNEPAPVDTARAAILPSEHPLGEADLERAPDSAIAASPTPIAEAVAMVAAAPSEPVHPAAAPVQAAGPVTIASIEAVEAVAPLPEPGSPPQAKRSNGGAGKGSRKR